MPDSAANNQSSPQHQDYCASQARKMVTPDLPYSGIFRFGNNNGFIQVPHTYDGTTPYPFILFCYGRGGSADSNNLTSPEFAGFRAQAAAKGYIVATPGYDSDCWFNDQAYHTTQNMLHFLQHRLNLQPNRFFVMGCSMGAAAALVFSARNADKITAACDIFGMTDFIRFYNEGLYKDSVSSAYGGSPTEKPQMYLRCSAVHQIDTLKKVPLLIVHGQNDQVVPIGHSQTLYGLLKSAGAKVNIITVPDVGHENRIMGFVEDAVFQHFANSTTQ